MTKFKLKIQVPKILDRDIERAKGLIRSAKGISLADVAEYSRRISNIEDPQRRAAEIQSVVENTRETLFSASIISNKHIALAEALERMVMEDFRKEEERIQQMLDGRE